MSTIYYVSLQLREKEFKAQKRQARKMLGKERGGRRKKLIFQIKQRCQPPSPPNLLLDSFLKEKFNSVSLPLLLIRAHDGGGGGDIQRCESLSPPHSPGLTSTSPESSFICLPPSERETEGETFLNSSLRGGEGGGRQFRAMGVPKSMADNGAHRGGRDLGGGIAPLRRHRKFGDRLPLHPR